MLAADRLAHGLEALNSSAGSSFNAAAQDHRICTGSQILEALADDGLSEQGSGGGAVAGNIVGLGGNFLDELGAHVLKRILELNFLGDGHTVVGDERAAVLLVENNIAALGSKGNLNGIGEGINSTLKRTAGFLAENNLLSHNIDSSSKLLYDRENIALTDDLALFAVNLDFGSGILGINDLLAFLHLHGDFLAIYNAAGADSDNKRILRFFFGRIGQDNTALGGLLTLGVLNDDTVEKGLKIHNLQPP